MAFFASASALAQSSSDTIVGTPWAGAAGVKETVATIMNREARSPKRLEPYYKYREKTGPDRTNLPQNPLSPKNPQAPVVEPALDSRSLMSGIRGDNGPLFSIGTSFDGADFSQALAWPPDTMGDVGPTQALVCVNGVIRVFDKNGNLGSLNATTEVFFNSVRRANSFTTDPRVRFDRATGRWFVIMIDALGTSSDKNNRVLIAVSSGSTITSTSSFTFFQFAQNAPSPAGDANAFFDYPTLGIDKNALYIGGNNFSPSFSGTTAFVVRKSSLTSGGPIVVTAFRNLINSSTGSGMFTPQGVDNDDPAATDGYLIGVDNATFGTLMMRRITNPGGIPSISGDIEITVDATEFPFDVRPLGTSSNRALDALDDRLYVAKIRTNRLTGAKTLWTSHNIGVNSQGIGSSADRTATRWYEISNLNGTPSARLGTIFDGSSNKKAFWIPAMTMTGQGIALMGMSSAGATQRTAVTVAQMLPGANQFETPVNALLSTADYNDASGMPTMRWGDYSHTVVDPTDDMTGWTFQMYAKTNTDWAVRVVKLIAPPPAAIASVTGASAAPGSSTVVTVNGTSTNGSGFFDPGVGFSNRLSASVSGSGVTVSNIQFVNPTQMKFTATVAAGTAAGARNITVQNPDGQSVTLSNSFTVSAGSVSIQSISLPETVASGTTTSVGTVTLSGAAPAGGSVVTLSSDNSALTVPASVTVAAGTSSKSFPLTAAVVGSPTVVNVTGTLGGTASASTTVRAPELVNLYVSPMQIVGGFQTKIKVTLSKPAPASGITVALTSSNPGVIDVPSTLTVPAGALAGVTNVWTTPVQSITKVDITAEWQGVTVAKTPTVKPPSVNSLTLDPSSIAGGSSFKVRGTVRLGGKAPAGGFVVNLISGDTTKVRVPSSVTVPAGLSQVGFDVTHFRVATDATVTITAKRGTASVTSNLTLTASGIFAVTFSPSSIKGGTSSVATVTLKSAAPAGGALVTLSSSSGSASVPASVVVPAGAKKATFTVNTSAVTSNTPVIITATYKGEWPSRIVVVP